MKIALVGYGNMGQELERVIAESKKHSVVSVSYGKKNTGLDKKGIQKADVVIEFTSPEIVYKNIEEIAQLNKNIVIGTTGWYSHMSRVKKIVKKTNIGLIYGQNFSIGANIFFALIEFSSKMFSRFGDYDVYGYEIHHSGKKDSPSGTAKKITQVIMDNFPRKTFLQENKLNRQIKENELHFASVRGGHNRGMHEVIFDSPADEIKLIHAAHGRRGFAQGAIMAAEFIQNKKGIYDFGEIFKEIYEN